MSDVTPETGPDGRRRRSERSRERILEALERALANPDLEITVEQIAAEAGVSLSTLFRHFGDLAGLTRAMNERIGAKVLPIMTRGPFVGELRARLRDLIDRRNQTFEITHAFRQVALRKPGSRAETRESEAAQRTGMRAQLEAALGAELAASSPETVAAVEALLSPQAWDQLRIGQGLGLGAIARTLENAVLALLEGDAP